MTALLVLILGLTAAVVALTTLRRHRAIVGCSVTLFALLIIQSGVGAATGRGARTLILIHLPLAMLVMGVGVYLSIAGTRARG
jgi:hypothetical protein